MVSYLLPNDKTSRQCTNVHSNSLRSTSYFNENYKHITMAIFKKSNLYTSTHVSDPKPWLRVMLKEDGSKRGAYAMYNKKSKPFVLCDVWTWLGWDFISTSPPIPIINQHVFMHHFCKPSDNYVSQSLSSCSMMGL